MKTFQTGGNLEQQKAIFHHGGVLLSAGAGSGKTFVLVEHVTYLIWQHRQDNLATSKQDYIGALKDYLSGIVLMTFTKKAAGELAIRLKGKIVKMQEQSEQEDDLWLWQQASVCIDSMTIGTIDGFCYKLIKQGFFPGLPVDIAIVSDLEINQKIADLYDEWLSFSIKKSQDITEVVDSFFVNSRDEFITAFVKIFTTPELRLLWREMSPEQMLEYDWDLFCDIVFGNDHPKNLLQKIPGDVPAAKGAWVEKLATLTQYFNRPKSWDINDLFELDDFFNLDRKIVSNPPKIDSVKEFFSSVKEVRDIVAKIAPELKAYEVDGKDTISRQGELMLEAFRWIEGRYTQIEGFTFADLEYFVLLGLRDAQAKANVNSRYKYLIVDEFQDTSRIQFEIIQAIINSDFNRLFCVGDEKQAIYGFRGGELAVFQDLKQLIPTRLELANNYRSQGNVINFNNAVFKDIFKRGQNFIGLDPHPVEVVAQQCPLPDRVNQGEVVKNRVTINIEEKTKIGESNIIEFESKAIFNVIEKSLELNPAETICVLYKGLKPSLDLMSELLKAGVGVRAQVKIPYPQDPVLALFANLVQCLQLARQKNLTIDQTPCKFFAQTILGYLEITIDDIAPSLNRFEKNHPTIGLYNSFVNFLHEIGLANSNHAGNMAEVKRLTNLSGGNLESILGLIKNLASRKYSIEFQSPGLGQIVIMTAHASKGLQFPHVILGGIHANGRRIANKDIVGKLPGSLRWRSKSDQKKKHRTPQMIMESAADELKDFAESKRLFYVACTRAERRISWIDLCDSNAKELIYNKDSWINGLRSFEGEESNVHENLAVFDVIKNQSTNWSHNFEPSAQANVSEASLPMFHLDPLGITAANVNNVSSLVLYPELSVTKLATITQCPRKFYLKHICKIDDDFGDDDRKEALEDQSRDLEEIAVLNSSAQRGTLIHEAIAYALNHHGVISLQDQKQMSVSDKEAVEWAVKKVLEISDGRNFVSEKPLKFDLFGQMVSGTPDLFILPSDEGELTVVDFKTGRPGDEKEIPYWFQLKSYAYAIEMLYPEHQFKQVNLELWYVDQAKIKVEQYDTTQIKSELQVQWHKLTRLFETNIKHCNSCSFGKICHTAGR